MNTAPIATPAVLREVVLVMNRVPQGATIDEALAFLSARLRLRQLRDYLHAHYGVAVRTEYAP